MRSQQLITELMERLWQRHKVELDRCCSSLTSFSSLWRSPVTWVRLTRFVLMLHLGPQLANNNGHISMTYMKPSVFTGRIRHLGFGILIWFVAQGFEFVTLFFFVFFCHAVLLDFAALIAP